MNSFELNKIMGAVLGTCLLVLVTSIAADAIFAPQIPEKSGYEIAVKEEAGATKAAAAPAAVPIATLLQSASVEKGEAAAKKCAACHTFEKGGANKVGPNLFNIVDEPRGEGRDFNFSAGMKAKPGKWTFEDLDKFLENPKGFIPGTAMGFAGIKKDSERADVIDYLRSLSDSPVPLPAAPSKPEGAEAAPAGAAPTAAPAPAGGKSGAAPAGPASIETRLQSASVEKGQAAAKKCAACHTFEKGGANKVGPNLFNIVDEPRGEGRDFNFSAGMKAKPGKWTFEDLDKFIESPKGFVPGTSMGFAGIKKDGERADLIGYLRTLSDHPVPLPKAN